MGDFDSYLSQKNGQSVQLNDKSKFLVKKEESAVVPHDVEIHAPIDDEIIKEDLL